MKTVYLHIGNFKTGTSAIQEYCSRHRDILLKNDIDYIRSGRSASAPKSHATLPLSMLYERDRYTPAWYRRQESSAEVLSAVRKEIESSGCNNILISSEEFYRIAGLSEKVAEDIMNNLTPTFAGFQVKVLMYVKPPLQFLKSWYNQANKANVPIRRFIDFTYYLNSSLLLPRRNATLWRKHFGQDCLIIEPYNLAGSRHLERFFELLDLEPDSTWSIPDTVTNPKRREDTMELDRKARILALNDSDERKLYLENEITADAVKLKKLEEKIDGINRDFALFCQQESIIMDHRPISIADLLRHEQLVNSKAVNAPGLVRRLRARAYNQLSQILK
jgi:hypothetical protein